jgi:hypothetical protein
VEAFACDDFGEKKTLGIFLGKFQPAILEIWDLSLTAEVQNWDSWISLPSA